VTTTRPVTGPATPPVILDGGDRCCVELQHPLRRLVDQAPVGTVIHVLTTDPGAPLDLPAWCRLTGHSYLGPIDAQRQATVGQRTYALRIATNAHPTRPRAPWHRTSPAVGGGR
jgi:tRNA 2-thiouridine synthesizing protein A